MNVFNKVTLQVLKKNRTRTIVTIIGVILSAAMITAVTTFITSIQNYMVQNAIALDGDWHVEFLDVDSSFTKKLSADKQVKNVAVMQNIGYSPLKESQNEYKPYLFVSAFSDEAFQTIPLKVISGRLPQNSSELLISDYVESNAGVKYNIGDQVTLETGERTAGGEKLGQNNPYQNGDGSGQETFVPGSTKSYTIVGVCARPNFEPYSAPGYSVITKFDAALVQPDDRFNAFVKLNQPRKVYEYSKSAAGDHGYKLNSDLLRYLYISNDDNFNTVLYSLGAILIGLIMVGSVLLIHNSFSISVSERTRQFGILSSVGATKKQLRKSVLFEGVCIGLIGLPLGIITGIGGIGLTLALISGIFEDMSATGLPFVLSVSALSVLAAAFVGIVTILISAYIPAKKASKLSAIDAIRQTTDIKINAKNVKTSKIIQKLFGLEGTLALKNFKRNKKRYRSTVISLFVSVVLFISASAFGMYLQQGMMASVEDTGFDISFVSLSMSDQASVDLYGKMKNVSGITDSGYHKIASYRAKLPENMLTERYKEYTGAQEEHSVTLFFIDDQTYKSYVSGLGLSPQEYNGQDMSKMVATAKITGYNPGSGRYQVFDIFKNHLPISLSLTGYEETTEERNITLSHITDKMPENISMSMNSGITVFVPYSARTNFLESTDKLTMTFSSKNPDKSVAEMNVILKDMNITSNYSLYNVAEMLERSRSLLLVINVFTYGFIILISLITIANVFNTVSTNINLRRREFAMLKSVGMTNRGFNKMINFECVFYGIKSLLFGLPTAFIITYLIYKSVMAGADVPFSLPWMSVGISILSVFFVVFVTMLYSVSKIKRENTVDALKSDL